MDNDKVSFVESILNKHAPSTDLLGLCVKHGSDKSRFCPVYETYMQGDRDKELNFLEIGVGGYDDPAKGGASVRMWKEYFQKASIFAIDVFDKSPHEEQRIKIFKGSQDNVEFLNNVAGQIGRIDVVIDDGSHLSHHVVATFNALFPLLASGGIYFIEDIGTSYWPGWGGSEDLNDPKTSVNFFKRLADGINSDHHRGTGYVPTYADKNTEYVHFYNNLIVVRKK